jgi:predicted nucleotidyltransferase
MGPLYPARAVLESWPAVRLAYVFGSTARGEARTSSDVDIGVVVDPRDSPVDLADLGEQLERALSRRVDLLDLHRASPLLRREVLRDGVLLLCRDEATRAAFESRALAEYLDTQHLRDVQRQYLRERVESRLGPSRTGSRTSTRSSPT